MRTWTIILAAATLLLASCSEEDIKPDKTLTGSISNSYGQTTSKVYLNGEAIKHEYRASTSFSKLNDTHVRFSFGIGYNVGDLGCGIVIESLEVHGRPYDVSFDYYSESDNDEFYINNFEKQSYTMIKIEGWLRAEGYADNTASISTRDWSPPELTGAMKITVLLEDDNEYIIEITHMS